ncbi:glycoside hydrolase family 3 N-terminal domain-containing protein [Sinorhizobium sp. BG8]|uniref:glycoside hydrolase family 3 N-terminal domain-containing protein n=1 Tax=Sinorhizobium sp. BG8 TaxID=2613773 RepID=UPI001FEE82E4|nr:glycoside hydrolase family 3 N-terminal domain-containing protein [Sinorhizobium sp. BG8]
MTSSIDQDARAVFLPAFDNLQFEEALVSFLEMGGCSVLIGESRAEYVARAMSKERLAAETPDKFRACIARLKARRPELIVAVDQEIGGIERLQGLVSPLPGRAEANSLSEEMLEERCFRTAAAARELGVTMFLAPIADIVDGSNPWLSGRTPGNDLQATARMVAAFVRGVQRAGCRP